MWSIPCSECSGTGRIKEYLGQYYDEDIEKVPHYVELNCPHCGGTGRVPVEEDDEEEDIINCGF